MTRMARFSTCDRSFTSDGATKGGWTDSVRGDLDWDDLLTVELVALRHTMDRKERALNALRELRNDLEIGVEAPGPTAQDQNQEMG